jgi:hypothetical protein
VHKSVRATFLQPSFIITSSCKSKVVRIALMHLCANARDCELTDSDKFLSSITCDWRIADRQPTPRSPCWNSRTGK